MNKFITIKEAAAFMGVSTQTLRRWERQGKLMPVKRTHGGQRRYDLTQFHSSKNDTVRELSTIAYARVSSHDQKEDLQRQEQMLDCFCASRGWTFEIISDLGSGLNYSKKGLRKLLQRIINGEISRLVITHKDRLLRFGAELIFAICEVKGIEIVIINKGDPPTFEEELAADVLEIITVFSARLYGSRSHKNKKLMSNLKKAVEDVKQ
jgi:excisionase family DNA binding protein